MKDISDICLRCGTPIGQIDETDLRCYVEGERPGRHEFSLFDHRRRQQGDQEKLAEWEGATSGWKP